MSNNDDLMRQLSAAMKGSVFAVTDLGSATLPIEKFQMFVKVMQEPTVILKDARRIDMKNGRADIDRIGFMSRILLSGGNLASQAKSAAQAQTALTTSNGVVPTITTNELRGREYVALVSLQDQVLKRNIEGGNFANTMIQLMGEAVGRDLEETFLLAHLNYGGSVSGNALTDGWLELAGNKVYGTYGDKSAGIDTTVKTACPMAAGDLYVTTTANLTATPIAGDFFRVGVVGSATEEYFTVSEIDATNDYIVFTTAAQFAHAAGEPVVQLDQVPDFNPNATNWPENLFDAMIEGTPKRYMTDMTRWAFYVPWEIMNAYQDLLKARNTQLGDQAMTQNPRLFYKGIAVKVTPMLDRSEAYNASYHKFGQVALLTSMDNLAWGIEEDVKIEPERDALARRTDFVLTFNGDCGYEDEDAATAAFIDVPAPAPA